MKHLISAVAFMAAIPSASLALEVDRLFAENINVASCTESVCVVRQIEACQAAVEAHPDGGYMMSHSCAHKAFDEADALLNNFYTTTLAATKRIEAAMAGSIYGGQEDLLRTSQRSWIDVRDTTCEMNVAYGGLSSGSEAVKSACKAKLTIQRITDLKAEIGQYLD